MTYCPEAIEAGEECLEELLREGRAEKCLEKFTYISNKCDVRCYVDAFRGVEPHDCPLESAAHSYYRYIALARGIIKIDNDVLKDLNYDVGGLYEVLVSRIVFCLEKGDLETAAFLAEIASLLRLFGLTGDNAVKAMAFRRLELLRRFSHRRE